MQNFIESLQKKNKYEIKTVMRTVAKIIGQLELQHKVSIVASEEWISNLKRVKKSSVTKRKVKDIRRIDLVMRKFGLILLIDWKFSCLKPHKIAERESTKMLQYILYYKQ